MEKDFSSGVMIFMHKHFVRGDKKKCLAMRSIVNVKKPSAAASIVTMNRGQGYRDVGTIPTAGDVMVDHLLQSNRQRIHSGDASMFSNVGYGGAANNMLGGRANPGLSMNYGIGMQMQMPQSNYLLPNRIDQIMSSLANNRREVAQRSSAAATVAAVLHANQGYSAPVSRSSAGSSNIGGLSPHAVEEVNLASLIMTEDPTLDAWEALQLAKMCLSTSITNIRGDRIR